MVRDPVEDESVRDDISRATGNIRVNIEKSIYRCVRFSDHHRDPVKWAI
jgi:hypothetical protein